MSPGELNIRTDQPNDLHTGFVTFDRLYHRAVQARKRRRERSEISCSLKYFVFSFNVIFLISGTILIGVSIWAWTEKDVFSNFQTLARITVDPVLIIFLGGSLMALIGFFGSTGALRENTCLLSMFCFSIAVIFLVEVIFTVLGFVYKDLMIERLKSTLNIIVVNYRENVDLRDLIDWIQATWLRCCGIDGPGSWEANRYFNCSSPSAEKCGVPPSCCKPSPGREMRNLLCGRNIRHPSNVRFQAERIFTMGCLYAGQKWVEDNLLPVAGSLVALAVIQVFSVCLAQNLRSDIFAQRARWERVHTEVR